MGWAACLGGLAWLDLAVGRGRDERSVVEEFWVAGRPRGDLARPAAFGSRIGIPTRR